MTLIPHRTADGLARLSSIQHGFFGRAGGVSTGIYQGLNAGPGSKDNARAVADNRARIANVFGVQSGEYVLSGYQVHSARAEIVSAPWGQGARPEVDALVTNTPGLVLCALLVSFPRASGTLQAAGRARSGTRDI